MSILGRVRMNFVWQRSVKGFPVTIKNSLRLTLFASFIFHDVFDRLDIFIWVKNILYLQLLFQFIYLLNVIINILYDRIDSLLNG